ncbi:MAG: hypothetical protein IPK27_17330 [Rhodanobacteraceae bacterium]|nr:hypothetical protein [Rhodanobacteraceae bacterium]
MRAVSLALAMLVLASTASAGSPTIRWPDTTPGGTCTGLGLQQCIDAAPTGVQLRVVRGSGPTPRYHAIPGTLTIRRAMYLRVDPGVDAVLPEGADIICRPAAGASGYCGIEGFTLRRGSIVVDALNAVPSAVLIQRNRIGIPPAAQASAGIEVSILNSATADSWDVEAVGNVLFSTGPDGATGIRIAHALDAIGALRARVSDNLVESSHPQGMRSGIFLIRRRGDEWRAERNLVRGPTDTSAVSGLIVMSQVLEGSTSPLRIADNWVHAARNATGAGILVNAIEAPIAIQAVNNSVIEGTKGIEMNSVGAGGVIDLHNNLVVGQSSFGMHVAASQAIIRESHNALFANAADASGFTLSPTTLLSDPMIERRDFPRPRAGSPLVDAGDANAWVAGAGAAIGDVAGDPRELGAGIDIGAFEWNRHRVFQHTVSSDNLTANHTLLPPEIADTDLPVAVGLRDGSSNAQLDQTLGLWSPSGGRLAIYHEQQLPMSVGQSFIVARLGDAFPFAFAHDSLTPGPCTAVSGLNDRSVAIAMHRFEGPAGAALLPAPISFLREPGTGWMLCDERNLAIPADRRFHVVAPPADSANAFFTPALEQFDNQIPLAHRLLDGTPCALPVVGRGHDTSQSFIPFNPTPFALQHTPPTGPGAPSRWVVHAVGSQPSPTFTSGGSSFNVILSGAQALRCRVDADLLRSGFE